MPGQRRRLLALRAPALFLACIALAACEAEPESRAPAPDLGPLVAGHCEARRFEDSQFTACRFDPEVHEIALFSEVADGPLRSFDRLEAHLGERTGRLLFAMNAGMYDEAGRPVGLHIEEGVQRHAINRRDGPGNFHMKPNGIFAVDRRGRPLIVDSEDWNERRVRWATQSGPLLVIDGAIHPRIRPNGESLNIRNGVGVTEDGTAWFAISEEPVSFGRFARFFRDGLDCPDALFLDGSVSSLWDPAAHRRDGRDTLGPLVGVFESPAGKRPHEN